MINNINGEKLLVTLEKDGLSYKITGIKIPEWTADKLKNLR